MNLRTIATPLTIGGFVLMSVTGVLMFFHKEAGLNKEAHEWLSWAFLVGAALHVTINFTAFKRYFKPSLGLGIIVIFAAILSASFFIKGEEGKGGSPLKRLVMNAMNSPISEVAAIADKDPAVVVASLRAKGFEVADANQSINQIAGGDKEKGEHIAGEIFAR